MSVVDLLYHGFHSARVLISPEVLQGLRNVIVFLNFTSEESQLMNGLVPWRGPREKDLSFMQGLIEVLTRPGDIILDWFASTGDTLFHVHFLLTY